MLRQKIRSTTLQLHTSEETSLMKRVRNDESGVDSSFDSELGHNEDIKRRRANQPFSELRLANDLEILKDTAQNVRFEYSEDGQSELMITFMTDLTGYMSYDASMSLDCPQRFLLRILKDYPYTRPLVTCLDSGFECFYIATDGSITHKSLCDDWSPICGLGEIVGWLEDIRVFCGQRNRGEGLINCPTAYSTSGMEQDEEGTQYEQMRLGLGIEGYAQGQLYDKSDDRRFLPIGQNETDANDVRGIFSSVRNGLIPQDHLQEGASRCSSTLTDAAGDHGQSCIAGDNTLDDDMDTM
jgi:ubiquitin-protein ligase